MSWLFLKPNVQHRSGLIFRISPRARPVSPSPRPEARAGSPCPLPPVTAAACALPPCLRDTGAGIAGLKRKPLTMATSALPRRMSLAARSTWPGPARPTARGARAGLPASQLEARARLSLLHLPPHPCRGCPGVAGLAKPATSIPHRAHRLPRPRDCHVLLPMSSATLSPPGKFEFVNNPFPANM